MGILEQKPTWFDIGGRSPNSAIGINIVSRPLMVYPYVELAIFPHSTVIFYDWWNAIYPLDDIYPSLGPDLAQDASIPREKTLEMFRQHPFW